ncbi:MAG: hypothetical protein K0S56_919 [Microvirga sp.]|jgi:hypothetical protein|nr:hypothetical protein [Microvirga sp.]
MFDAPEPPDPYATAQAQAGFNQQTALTQQALNMVNQVTPYGSLTYSQTGQQWVPNPTGGGQYMPAPSGAPPTDQQAAPSNGMRGNEPAPGEPGSTGNFLNGRQPMAGQYIPQYTATTQFSPSQQAIFDRSQAALQNLAQLAQNQSKGLIDHLGKPMDFSGAPALQTSLGNDFTTSLGSNYTTQLGPGYTTSYAGADDFSADRQRTEEALWQRGASERQAQENALRTRLTNAGVREGSAAWNAEMERMGRQTTDAQLATYLAGGQEQSRLVELARQAAQFGNDATMNQALFGNQSALAQAQFGNNASLQQAGFNNQARSQWMDEAYAQRNQPLNELAGLLSLSQVQNPTSSNVQTPQTAVGGVDFMGLAGDNYKNQSDNYQEMLGGMFDLATAGAKFLPMSDARAKEDIRRVGQTDGGTPLYVYRYKGTEGPYMVGVMAQEVDDDARAMGPDGLWRVDYGRVR